MPDTDIKFVAYIGIVLIIVGLFALLGALTLRDIPILAAGVASLGLGIALMSVAGYNHDENREECAVVGTNAEDATYVCVEVTE